MIILAPRRWINDELIDYIARKLIRPGAMDIHPYISHSMTSLLNPGQDAPYHDYRGVSDYVRSIKGGLLHLDELYVSINANLSHWNFTRVKPQTKVIELWDSLGPRDTANQEYPETMRRYIYDEIYHTRITEATPFNIWKQ